jgi:tryptophan synthase alpha subunit
VVGSAIVRVIEEHAGPGLPRQLEDFVRNLKNGFGAHA